MNSNTYILSDEVDLKSFKRLRGITEDYKMEKLYIDVNELQLHQPLVFSLKFYGKISLDNLVLRFVVYDKSGSVIGTAYSKYFSGKKEYNKVKFEFDTSLLVPGEYSADIIFCSYDGKIQLRHDIVTKALSFKINETKLYYNMNWIRNSWGNIKFFDINILEE